jgi:transposase
VIKKKLKRRELLSFFANYTPSLIGLEACGGAHHWARELIKLGHEVILLNVRYVKSFVVGNKNDYNDAAAIFDAVTRPNKRVVSIKTIAQQDIHMAHGVRKEHVDFRTALVNQTRGFLSERGIVMAKSVNQFRKRLPEMASLLYAENSLPKNMNN